MFFMETSMRNNEAYIGSGSHKKLVKEEKCMKNNFIKRSNIAVVVAQTNIG